MPDYKIIRKKGFSSSASISVSADKGVVVRAPFWMTKGMIDGFVREKSDWININLNKIKSNKVTKKYCDGEKHLFFGEEYTLRVIRSSSGRNKAQLKGNEIIVEINNIVSQEKYQDNVKDALLYWYMEKGIEAITEKVNYFTKSMGVDYRKISLKKVSTIWGSCSPSNCLSFNRKLVMAPHEVVDYVVIHEVAHMTHRNHSQRFWDLVKSYDGDFKRHRKWLRVNHHLLSL